jgi:hypothetical protein
MKFSEGRQSYLAHLFLRVFRDEGLATIEKERLALNEIKHVLSAADSIESAIDTAVRRKIESLSRKVPPGSREWEILYRQYHQEEERRRGGR